VTDAIAEVLGTRVHCLCTNGFGAARDVLASRYVTDDRDLFREGVRVPDYVVRPKRSYAVSHVMPQWVEALGLTRREV
jgi:hypothetical protein